MSGQQKTAMSGTRGLTAIETTFSHFFSFSKVYKVFFSTDTDFNRESWVVWWAVVDLYKWAVDLCKLEVDLCKWAVDLCK